MGLTIETDLPGKTARKIYMDEEFLKFETNGGSFVYTVEGDCCSRSLFYDFVGVKHLLRNGPVTAVKEVDLEPDEKSKGDVESGELKIYGYALTTESPEFGEQTSVFSFRNYSNGYYGGWMEAADDREVSPEITDDVLETASVPSA